MARWTVEGFRRFLLEAEKQGIRIRAVDMHPSSVADMRADPEPLSVLPILVPALDSGPDFVGTPFGVEVYQDSEVPQRG